MSDQSVDTTYIGRVGIELDIMLNVIAFDGENGVTVSEHSAQAMQAGKTWGCIMCKLLSALVQKNHCELVLTNQPTPEGAAIKALFWILVALVGVPTAAYEAITHIF